MCTGRGSGVCGSWLYKYSIAIVLSSHSYHLPGDDTCLLNPTKNSPMKIFQIRQNDIANVQRRGVGGLQMRLSRHEQEINDIPNTVLLIGRSGTGTGSPGTLLIC